MAKSMTGQDELLDYLLELARWDYLTGLDYLLFPVNNCCSLYQIIKHSLTKLVWPRRFNVDLVPFVCAYASWPVNTQKQNLANIKPS